MAAAREGVGLDRRQVYVVTRELLLRVDDQAVERAESQRLVAHERRSPRWGGPRSDGVRATISPPQRVLDPLRASRRCRRPPQYSSSMRPISIRVVLGATGPGQVPAITAPPRGNVSTRGSILGSRRSINVGGKRSVEDPVLCSSTSPASRAGAPCHLGRPRGGGQGSAVYHQAAAWTSAEVALARAAPLSPTAPASGRRVRARARAGGRRRSRQASLGLRRPLAGRRHEFPVVVVRARSTRAASPPVITAPARAGRSR